VSSFEQLKVIGRGGFSRVVLCRKKDTGMLYAMKIVAKSTAKRHRVLAEKDIMTRLDHPRIVKLHWAFQTQSELFFVLEVCPCGELFTHM
jgi:serine/threonine protein kinase